jgi:hypothetical protein
METPTMTTSVPCIGAWYRIPGRHCEFRVLALSDAPGTLRIRYANGSSGTLDMIAWHAMEAERIDPPAIRQRTEGTGGPVWV